MHLQRLIFGSGDIAKGSVKIVLSSLKKKTMDISFGEGVNQIKNLGPQEDKKTNAG